MKVDKLDVSELDAHGFTLRARTLTDLGFPVPTLQPLQPNKVLALDLQPSGTPIESPGNGYTWLDCCDADVMTANDRPVHCARVAMRSDGAYIGHTNFNGAISNAATPKATMIGVNNTPMWDVNYNGVFYPHADNTYQIGSGSNRPTAVYSVNGNLQTCDAREKDVLQDFDVLMVAAILSRVKIRAFRWKGSAAGIRFGPLAQDIQREFEKAGLNVHNYSLLDIDPNTGRLSVDLVQFNLLRALIK